MDIDHSGKINFNEYVISTWNYLSCDMDVLTAFAFSLFDIDDSKTLEPDEIQQMVPKLVSIDYFSCLIYIFFSSFRYRWFTEEP